MGLINGAPRWVGLLTWAYKEKHQNKSSKRTHFSALWPLRFELIHTLFIQWPSHAFLLFSLSTLGQFLVTDWKFSILFLICTCMKWGVELLELKWSFPTVWFDQGTYMYTITPSTVHYVFLTCDLEIFKAVYQQDS